MLTFEESVIRSAIKVFGEDSQEQMAIEECSELIQAICHHRRGRESNIAEEIADVEIVLEQLKLIHKCTEETAAIRNEKINRLHLRICEVWLNTAIKECASTE